MAGTHTYMCVCVYARFLQPGKPYELWIQYLQPNFTSDVCNQWDSFCFSTRDGVQERNGEKEMPGQEGENCGDRKGDALPACTGAPFRCS